MATLADVAVEESAHVQQELKVLFHQLCMLFGLLIMLLLTESTLYWLNHIQTPRPPNQRALLLGRINNWVNEVEDDSDGTPPNMLTSNFLTSGTANPPSSTTPSAMTKATTVSSATSGVAAAGKVAGKFSSKIGLYLLISLILHSFLGHPVRCASHQPGREQQWLRQAYLRISSDRFQMQAFWLWWLSIHCHVRGWWSRWWRIWYWLQQYRYPLDTDGQKALCDCNGTPFILYLLNYIIWNDGRQTSLLVTHQRKCRLMLVPTWNDRRG